MKLQENKIDPLWEEEQPKIFKIDKDEKRVCEGKGREKEKLKEKGREKVK